MIYYYQIKYTPLTAVLLPNEECPVCGKTNTIEVVLYMRYLRSLVPFFGMGRTTEVYCTSCDHVIKDPAAPFYAKKNYSSGIAENIKNIRASHKRTWWQLIYPWTICWLMLVLAGYGLINQAIIQKKIRDNQELLENPVIGDIYKVYIYSQFLDVNTTDQQGMFTLFKLNHISGDTLFMICNKEYPLNYGFQESDWKNLSRNDDAFKSKTYKISFQKLLDTTSERPIWQYYDKTALDSIRKTSPKNNETGQFIGRLCHYNTQLKIIERP
ncbi:hypothetical protein [Flavobacterium cupreum]|nr:hypothetical protein [Flavobacterium cupreum]